MELASIPVANAHRHPGEDLSLNIPRLRCTNLYSLFEYRLIINST
jgi:hypothetical protein